MRTRRRRPSAESLPRKATRPPARSLSGTTARHDEALTGPPGKNLAGSPGKTHAKRTGRATPRPAPAKSSLPFACNCRPNQLGRHLRGSMQPFVEAPPPRHLSCLPAYMAPHASLARSWSKREGAATDGTGLAPVPDKVKGHLRHALNVSCPVMTSDKLAAL